MRNRLGAVLFLAGVGAGVGIAKYQGVMVVHAQSSDNYSGCRTLVAKDWGKYQGSSLFGLTFEDEKGTLRFVGHPNCGGLGGLGQGGESAAASIADLTIVRQ